jgi:hypothetical protein
VIARGLSVLGTNARAISPDIKVDTLMVDAFLPGITASSNIGKIYLVDPWRDDPEDFLVLTLNEYCHLADYARERGKQVPEIRHIIDERNTIHIWPSRKEAAVSPPSMIYSPYP